METSNASLTFKSVDEILWCNHSIETSSAVLSLGTICSNILQNEIWDVSGLVLDTLGSERVKLPYWPLIPSLKK